MRTITRRAIAAHWTALTLIGLIIAICGATLYAIPGYLDHHRATALRGALTTAQPGAADLTVTAGLQDPYPAGVDTAQQAIWAALSPTLHATVALESTTVRSAFGATGHITSQQPFTAPDGDAPQFALRTPYGSGGKLRAIAGAAPPAADGNARVRPEWDEVSFPEPAIPVWISQENATALHVSVGDQFTVSDKTYRHQDPVPLQVVGIFAPVDSADPYWRDPDGGPTTLAEKRIDSRPGGDGPVKFWSADLLIQNGDVGRAARETDLTGSWSYDPVSGRITPANAAVVAADLTRLSSGGRPVVNPTIQLPAELQPPRTRLVISDSGRTASTVLLPPSGPPIPVQALQDTPAFVSQLPAILDGYLHDAGTAMVLMSLGLSCLLAVAVGVLVLAIRLLLHRQREQLAVCHARGASVPMLGRMMAQQIAAVAVPAAALAAAAVVAAGYARPGLGIGAAALATSLGTCLLTAAMTIGHLHGAGARTAQEPRSGARADAVVRVTIEAFVFLVLAAEITALHSRGITGDPTAGIDPLTAALPAAIALAAGVVVLRLRPLLPAFLGWLLGNGRGATGFVGTANARRDSAIGAVASLVILVTLSSAVFGATFTASLTDARDRSEWQAVGAPARITDPLARLDTSAITPGDIVKARSTLGITAVSAAAIDQTATIQDQAGGRQNSITLVAMDVPGYANVIHGTPLDTPTLRSGLTTLAAASRARPASAYSPYYHPDPPAVPVATSPELAAEARSHGLTATIGSRLVPLNVVAVLDGLPTGIATGPVVLIGYDLEQAASTTAMVHTDIFAAGTPSGLAALQNSRTYSDPTTTVTLESSLHTGANSRPLAALVQRLQIAETALEVALCALAVLLTLAIGAAARGRTAAFLATMGFGNGRLRRVAIIETLPLLLLVTAAGIATGIAVLPILAGSIDLPTLTGLTTQLRVHTDPVAITVAGAAVPGMALAAVLAERFLRRRLGIISVLRAGGR